MLRTRPAPPRTSWPTLCGLDLDGVVCDLGPGVASRIAHRFGVASHPDTWRTFDLRRLPLDVPRHHFDAFIDEVFADPELYEEAPASVGAVEGVRRLAEAGWDLVGITARPGSLASVTRSWLDSKGIHLRAVHHSPVGTKSTVARHLGVAVTIEDNPHEAELLAEVCESWLLDRPYNREYELVGARRLGSWDDAVGRFCQLPLFA